jgi:hypothetical protein
MKAFWFLVGFVLVLATAANATTPGKATSEFKYNDQVKMWLAESEKQGYYVNEPQAVLLEKSCEQFCKATYFVSIPLTKTGASTSSISGTIVLPELTSEQPKVKLISTVGLERCN